MHVTERLKRTILKELGLDEFELTGDTVPSDVPGWDSLGHVRVIDAVEHEFGLRFRGLEVLRLRSVADLQALVDRKTAGR